MLPTTSCVVLKAPAGSPTTLTFPLTAAEWFSVSVNCEYIPFFPFFFRAGWYFDDPCIINIINNNTFAQSYAQLAAVVVWALILTGID